MLVPLLRVGALPALCLAASVAGAQTDPAAQCRDRSQSYEAIVAACDAAVAAATDPADQGDLLAQRARAHRLLGDFDSARADVEEAMRVAAGDADPWIERAYMLREDGDPAGAAKAAEQALALEPGYWRAVLVTMDLQGDVGNYDRCLALGETAKELAPERAQTYAYLGRCLYELMRDEEALAEYERAAEIGLEEAYFHANRSMAYWALGRYDEALASARHAVELDSTHEGARYALIEALFATGAPDEALAAFREGQELGVEDTTGLANLTAWELYLLGRHEEALPIIEEWFAAHPDLKAENVYEADTRAHILAALGRTDEAVEGFLQAAELGGPEKRAAYEQSLTELGFAPSGAGFEAALRACAAAGDACLLDG